MPIPDRFDRLKEALDGRYAVLREGSGEAADSVSQVCFFRPGTLTCQEIDPQDVGPLAVPIVSGNVQVH